jgi:hypothetical protein
MKKISGLFLFLHFGLCCFAQSSTWTEIDRKYLVDNLARSRDEVMKETQGLSKEQLTFKESPERWSINQIVEHIARWEMLFDHEISRSLGAGAQLERLKTVRPDSTFVNFIYEQKPHFSLEYTKPFSYTIPMGLNDISSSLAWFSKMRNESISFIISTKDDLRLYFNSYGSIHQIYIYVFGHTDRHLRQIRKVKTHPNYPK